MVAIQAIYGDLGDNFLLFYPHDLKFTIKYHYYYCGYYYPKEV